MQSKLKVFGLDSFNEIIDYLLENYWSGWGDRKPRLAGWGKKVPILDRLGRNIRNQKPRYGTKKEISAIVSWKRLQTGAKFDRVNNNDYVVRKITEKAFAKERITGKVKTLSKLNQVSTVMASAILRFVNPNKYGTVDWRNWYVLSRPNNRRGGNNKLFNIFGKPLLNPLVHPSSSSEITTRSYIAYLKVIRSLSTRFPERSNRANRVEIIREIIDEYPQRTAAEIDMALFSYSWNLMPKKNLA